MRLQSIEDKLKRKEEQKQIMQMQKQEELKAYSNKVSARFHHVKELSENESISPRTPPKHL